MKCERIDRLLVAYLDGEVMPLEREEIEAHLAGCIVCAEELVAMRMIRRQIGATLQAVAATAVPLSQAWPHLQQRLEAHLVARMQQEVRTLGTMSQDKGEAHSPSWFQRLAQGVGRVRQVFQVRGGLTMKKGFALAAIAALIITISMVAFVPSARAWAQDVLGKFGAWIITDAPTLAEVPRDTTKATPIGLPTSTPFAGLQPIQPTPPPILPIEEASDVAGFQVLFPEYVPAGYRLVSRAVYTPEVGVLVFTTWATESGEEHMGINQMRYVPGYELEFPVGNAPTVDVTVRGQPGLWAEGAKLGSRGEEIVAINVLIWEEEDDLFRLTGDELTLAEMLKIAESLE